MLNSFRLDRFDTLTVSRWSETVEAPFAEVLSEASVRVESLLTLSVQAVSNDTDYLAGRTWGLYGDQTTPVNMFGSQAGEAWAAGHVGSMKVAIGVIDTGVDYLHPDLYTNIWLNQGEIPFAMRGMLNDIDGDAIITFRDLNSALNGGFVSDLNANGRIDGGDLLADTRWANGIDEAGNGYLDDLIGWDFVGNDNNPLDDHGHGTHVSGTIGARGGNGLGVAGIAWNTQIVPLKFLGADGRGTMDGAIGAIDYFTNVRASNAGIDFAATNNSWSGGTNSAPLLAAITRSAQADILFVAAAGNGTVNTDVTPAYPSTFSTLAGAGYDNIISVTAFTSAGALSHFSNYGAMTVDLGAPGSAIFSTVRGGGYGAMSGTSMAAPHVAGAIALFSASNPSYSAAQIRAELLGSVIATESLAGKTVTGGRLDVAEFVTVAVVTPSIYGAAGSDTVRGTAANERIYGVTQNGADPGKGTRDILYGGGGADIFVLADSRGIFYDDDVATFGGPSDRVQILDFGADDRIQLIGALSDYVLFKNTVGGVYGTTIYRDDNRNRRLDGVDEMIAHVSGSAAATALTPEYFLFG